MTVTAIFRQERGEAPGRLDPANSFSTLDLPARSPLCTFMRAATCFILIVFLAISFTLFAQTPSESRFLVRLKYIKSDLPLSASTTCIAVFPDGRFHLEQLSGWTDSKPQIYEDSVPDNDLKSLLTIIADPELRDLQGMDTGSVVFRQSEHGEVVWALISRGETTQKLLFNSQTGSPKQSSKALQGH